MQQLEFKKAKKLLEKYKLPLAKSEIVSSPEKAKLIAKKIRYPVAIKAISKEIIHKTDSGAVKVDIKDEKELLKSYEAMTKKIKNKIEGILVQKMEAGQEIIIGMKRDPQFDVVLIFGLGGIFTEILKDVSFRIAPIDKQEAEKMIDEIKASKILKGVRNLPPANIGSLANILTKLSKLALENKNIQEIDFNPVIVDEKTAKIVDVRIMADE
jgi:acetyl-CoA synthetase (ADP-forming)